MQESNVFYCILFSQIHYMGAARIETILCRGCKVGCQMPIHVFLAKRSERKEEVLGPHIPANGTWN